VISQHSPRRSEENDENYQDSQPLDRDSEPEYPKQELITLTTQPRFSVENIMN